MQMKCAMAVMAASGGGPKIADSNMHGSSGDTPEMSNMSADTTASNRHPNAITAIRAINVLNLDNWNVSDHNASVGPGEVDVSPSWMFSREQFSSGRMFRRDLCCRPHPHPCLDLIYP